MYSLVPSHISAELIADLDAQLIVLGCCAAHVVPGPKLIGVGWGVDTVFHLNHPQLDTYLEAEMIAQRVNGLQGTSDADRSSLVSHLGGVVL